MWITYDFAKFNSNFPGDRRFDLNPSSLRSLPFVRARVCICSVNIWCLGTFFSDETRSGKKIELPLGDVISVTRVFNR